jgi:thiosulfate dehydrogenase
MLAIVAYIKWLGALVPKGEKPYGSGIHELKVLDRAADPEKGKRVFQTQCIACHGEDGQGIKDADGIMYQYPPLWGPHSYNTGAGLFRLSRFAGYVKDNMPYRNNYDGMAQLTDEEAWDVAAFVNTQPRPAADISKDWPDISKKPFDQPFGPYADGFSEQQHKYGPFGPIKAKKR